MRWLSFFFGALLIVAVASPLQAGLPRLNLYVAPNASISGDCLSPATACRNAAEALTKCPALRSCNVTLAPGIYLHGGNNAGLIDVSQYRVAVLHGPLTPEGKCVDKAAVTLRASGQTLVMASQDHSILFVHCLSFEADGPGVTYIYSRQFGIVDAYDLRFGAIPVTPQAGGAFMAAAEIGKINCAGNIEVTGGGTTLLQISNSSADIGCTFEFTEPTPEFIAGITGTSRSVIDAHSAKFKGAFKGKAYSLDRGSLLALPSGGIYSSLPGEALRGSEAY